ncbi:MAG: hypothetical protein M1812_005996 [Candelaria pacifica]|nr:MAG: hypothetical protein M1812_005996 [Candelaria pacifica]
MDETVTARSFEFLKLPPELRNMVYLFAFSTMPSVFVDPEEPGSIPGITRPDCFGLIYANKQTYREALGLYYQINTFRASSTLQLYNFLKNISPIAKANITSLSLRWITNHSETFMVRYKTDNKAFRLLRECKALEDLYLEIDQIELTTGYSILFRMAPNIKQLRKVRGLKKLDVQDPRGVPMVDAGIKAWLAEEMLKPRKDRISFEAAMQGSPKQRLRTLRNRIQRRRASHISRS